MVVFDFDKTLTFRDTLTQLFLYRMKSWRFVYLPVYCGLKILSKFRFISVRKEKEISIKLLLPQNIDDFGAICADFVKTIKLTPVAVCLHEAIANHQSTLILSASPELYIKMLFPQVEVIGLTFNVDSDGKIMGIGQHPYGKEKLHLLQQHGISTIDEMYFDSISDECLIPISKKSYMVRQGHITQVLSNT